MTEVKLFRKNQLGIGSWRIWCELGDGFATLRYAHSTVLGGSEVHHKDIVTVNKSGRGLLEQAQLEMKSRIGRQLDKGYKPTIEEAKQGLTNQMGFMGPMLAQPLDKVRLTDRDFDHAYIQRKYDGHRTLITNFDGDLVPYTRKGKPIETIGHILKQLSWIPEGVTLDGELYIHGMALQGISSFIKRVQPGNVRLHFHWYDMHDQAQPGLTFHSRYQRMLELQPHDSACRSVAGGTDDDRCICTPDTYSIVPTYGVSSLPEAMGYFRRFREENYEGGILRLNTKPYQNGVRSNSLIKLKDWQDEEVTVISARPSKEGWAILTCKRDTGQYFDTSAPGSIPEKEEVLRNFDTKYKNRRLTIEYASLTNDGLPFHASALRWHEEL